MNANHAAAVLSHEYQPTLIETPLLIKRLAIQIAFFRNELQQRWIYCDRNPLALGRWLVTNFGRRLLQCVSQPHFVSAVVTAFAVIACSVALLLLIGRAQSKPVENVLDTNGEPLDVVVMDLTTPPTSASHIGLGKGGGSPQKPRAFGGGGNNDPHPPQAGKLPPPSLIPAAIPIKPPTHPQSLPVAGINIDPTQWKDLKAPVYGDPDSKSQIPSSGPGQGGGIGTGNGVGIGGAGFGPGCGGPVAPGTGCGAESGRRPYKGAEVDQRARVFNKPEPQYTEDARRNQISGTVVLSAVFASSGQVIQIRALQTLPFGLTESAITAARQIKFAPATKNGQPVSVSMQLEYNFNLY